jgi:hypothetical protein
LLRWIQQPDKPKEFKDPSGGFETFDRHMTAVADGFEAVSRINRGRLNLFSSKQPAAGPRERSRDNRIDGNSQGKFSQSRVERVTWRRWTARDPSTKALWEFRAEQRGRSSFTSTDADSIGFGF